MSSKGSFTTDTKPALLVKGLMIYAKDPLGNIISWLSVVKGLMDVVKGSLLHAQNQRV